MKTTITIESSIYGTYEYEGDYEILIEDEELTSIQILNLILSKLLKNKENITIQYWNAINWSETRIKIIQNKEDL